MPTGGLQGGQYLCTCQRFVCVRGANLWHGCIDAIDNHIVHHRISQSLASQKHESSPSSVIDAIAGDDGQYFIVLATSVVCIIERRVEVREGSHLWSVLQSTHQNDGTTTRSLVRAMHVWILCICILATRGSTCDEVFLRYGYVENYVLVTRN